MSAENTVRLLAAVEEAQCVLRLYVAGSTPQSSRAIRNLKALCETHLPERYALTVVDLYAQPELAREDQIVVAPTLVRQSPLPEPDAWLPSTPSDG